MSSHGLIPFTIASATGSISTPRSTFPAGLLQPPIHCPHPKISIRIPFFHLPLCMKYGCLIAQIINTHSFKYIYIFFKNNHYTCVTPPPPFLSMNQYNSSVHVTQPRNTKCKGESCFQHGKQPSHEKTIILRFNEICLIGWFGHAEVTAHAPIHNNTAKTCRLQASSQAGAEKCNKTQH